MQQNSVEEREQRLLHLTHPAPLALGQEARWESLRDRVETVRSRQQPSGGPVHGSCNGWGWGN